MSKILICVPVYDTEENGRFKYTKECAKSIIDTIDVNTTDVVFINNASYKESSSFLYDFCSKNQLGYIEKDQNVGTANAVNSGIYNFAYDDTYCVKLDNDVTFDERYWADEMVECFESDSTLGVLGLKRKDLPNSPTSKEYPTVLETLSNGMVIELCGDIIGTCQMLSPNLRKSVGYFYQPGVYGFDDNIMCHRSLLAGFRNAFYPSVGINHIDEGGDFYTEWKRKYARANWDEFEKTLRLYNEDIKNIYYNPFAN